MYIYIEVGKHGVTVHLEKNKLLNMSRLINQQELSLLFCDLIIKE